MKSSMRGTMAALSFTLVVGALAFSARPDARAAQQQPADLVITNGKVVTVEDAAPEVLRLTGGIGADVVIDTAGGATTLKAGIDMLRPGGRFCSFSLSHDPVSGVSAFPLYYKEVSIIGSRALTAEDIRASIDLVAGGKIDVRGFVSATYPLRRAPEAFKAYEDEPGKFLRIVIDSTAD